MTKHAIKQVDRLLSNGGIDVWESFARWVPHLVGSRTLTTPLICQTGPKTSANSG